MTVPAIKPLNDALDRVTGNTSKKSSKAGGMAKQPLSPEDEALRQAAIKELYAAGKAMVAMLPHRAKRKPAAKAAEGQKPAVAPPRLEVLDPAHIVIDPAVQPRLKLDEAVVEDYAEAMLAGTEFPSVVVFRDPAGGDPILADGFHRHAAAIRAGVKRMRAQVYTGTRRDATLHAAGANARHGLRRSNADKRRAVMLLLNDGEWSQFPDREIARRCGVTHPFVSSLRDELAGGNDYHSDTTDGEPGIAGTGEVGDGTDAAVDPAADTTEPSQGTSAAPAEPADDESSPQQADDGAADTGLETMIPTDVAGTHGPAAAEPSPIELMRIVLDEMQRDFQAYPDGIVIAIRDETGKHYPQAMAGVQALFDAALAKLKALEAAEAAAQAAAQAQAAVQAPA